MFIFVHFLPAGFEDECLSSSLLKSPCEVPPLSRAGSQKKEKASSARDDVFAPGGEEGDDDDDEDIIRDYEAVHGQLNRQDQDQPG